MTSTPTTRRPDGSVVSFVASAPTRSVTFGRSEHRSHGHGLGVGLGVDQARVAVAPRAADARAPAPGPPRRAGSRTARGTGGSPPRPGRRASCWIRGSWDTAGHGYGLRPGALGRVLAGVAADLVELLGRRVPRFEVVVGDAARRGRGRRRGAARRSPAAGGGRARRRRASWRRRRSSGPGVGTRVPSASYHVSLEMYLPSMNTGAGFQLSISRGEEVAPLEDQDLAAGIGEGVGEGATTGTAADDDHVVVVGHGEDSVAGDRRRVTSFPRMGHRTSSRHHPEWMKSASASAARVPTVHLAAIGPSSERPSGAARTRSAHPDGGMPRPGRRATMPGMRSGPPPGGRPRERRLGGVRP